MDLGSMDEAEYTKFLSRCFGIPRPSIAHKVRHLDAGIRSRIYKFMKSY
jgi:hypothetical protein